MSGTNRGGGSQLLWREDGLVEWLTAILQLSSGLLFALALRRGFQLGVLGNAREGLFLAALSLALIFTAGEEISWGQRLFGFATPDALVQINQQQEFNLHNLGALHYWKDGIAALATLGWGVILPVAVVFSRPLARLCQRVWLPVPPLWCVPHFAAAIGCRVVFKPFYGNIGVEAFEMLFGLAMMMLAMHACKTPSILYLERSNSSLSHQSA